MARTERTPRVGILVECGRDGLEIQLCRRICLLLREQHHAVFDEDIIPMDNKSRLLEECATVTRSLLMEGYERVVVLWDEEPAWPDKGESLCWKPERDHLLQAMRGADLDLGLIHLVCIERAFEAWLLHDDRLLSIVLSRLPAHPVKARPPANPDRIRNVKGAMIRLFRQHGHTYSDVAWARRLATNLENLKKLRRCRTFKRFAERVTGNALS
jgi:hypothetical protein